MSNTIQKGHPKGLYVLFITEMWERFSYYGMRAIFVLYMTKALLFDKSMGSEIYGSYTGLVYLTPLLGGYMADRYWGNRKSIIIGGILMAIGQFLMFASGSLYTNPDVAKLIMYTALAMLIFGNGFFKPNISTMVGQLYPEGDKRVDAAFTIFYMGINLGAFIAPLVCGALGEVYDASGNIVPGQFRWGFFAAGCGMLISVALFIWLKNYYLVTPDGKQIGDKPNVSRETAAIDTKEEVKQQFSMQQVGIWGGVFLVLLLLFKFPASMDWIGSFIFSLTIAAPGFIISDKSLSKIERERIWVIYIVAFFVIFFWSAFEQAGASLTFFAEEQTDREVGWMLSKGLLSTILGVLTIGLLLIGYWIFKQFTNEKKGLRELCLFLVLAGAAYLVYLIMNLPAEGIDYSTIPASMFQSVNAVAIVIFAPLFAILWTKLGNKNMEPSSPYKQAIGLFLLALGYLLIAFVVKDLAPGVRVSMIWLISLYGIHTFGELCLSPIGLSMVNKLAPVKFASLLMGVWFLSTSAANKFAGTLSGLYPEPSIPTDVIRNVETQNSIKILSPESKLDTVQGVQVLSLEQVNLSEIKDKDAKAAAAKIITSSQVVKGKKFLGYGINNLYDFFMLFVFMAGLSSVVLFFLSKRLVKMMNGVQ